MEIYFSPALAGFVTDATLGPIPDDAISVTEEQWVQLLEAQADGKAIVCLDGQVFAQEPAGPSPDAQMEIIRTMRDGLLRASDAMVGVPDFPISEVRRTELIAWRAQLRDLPAQIDPAAPLDTVQWPARPTWLGENAEVITPEQN